MMSEDMDQETQVLCDSIVGLINSNRAFMLLLTQIIKETDYSSPNIGKLLSGPYNEFMKSKGELERLGLFIDTISQ